MTKRDKANAKVEQNSIKKPKGFQVGDPKPANSGRKKGTPNKKTIGLEAKLEEKGLDAANEMIKLFYECEDPSLKYNILKEIFKYIYPQRKAVDMEVTGKDGEPLNAQKIFVTPAEMKEVNGHIDDIIKS